MEEMPIELVTALKLAELLDDSSEYYDIDEPEYDRT